MAQGDAGEASFEAGNCRPQRIMVDTAGDFDAADVGRRMLPFLDVERNCRSVRKDPDGQSVVLLVHALRARGRNAHFPKQNQFTHLPCLMLGIP